VYLRPGYEFDGQWNHFDPDTYKLAYVRIVDLFRAADVTNVLWVWHSAVFLPIYEGRQRMEWYPGDDYVDLFGASVFTAMYDDEHRYKGHTRQEMHDLHEWAGMATARHKPLAIVESTARSYKMADEEAADAWTSWFQPVFKFIEEYDVRIFAYINCDWDAQPMWSGDDWGDTRLQTNQDLAGRWNEEMDKPRWKSVFDVTDPETD
jgi:beta-mannanase